MNVPNNKRKKESQEKIKKVFINMIQNKELNQISVTDIVKKAHINRSTFYANFLDIYDLADKIKDEMYQNYLDLYKKEVEKKEHSYDFLNFFRNIKENQIYYKTQMKLNFDFTKYYDASNETTEAVKYLGTAKNIDYHIEFFKAGMSAIIQKWLANGCKESPEEMVEILHTEYERKTLL